MGELNLDQLERLAKAATPGPWEWWTSNSFLRLTGADRRDGGVLYACNIRNEYATVVVSEADRRFIAEARTALPALIARIRELEQDAARLDWLDDVAHCADWVEGEPTKRVIRADDGAEFHGDTWRAAIDAAREEKGHG